MCVCVSVCVYSRFIESEEDWKCVLPLLPPQKFWLSIKHGVQKRRKQIIQFFRRTFFSQKIIWRNNQTGNNVISVLYLNFEDCFSFTFFGQRCIDIKIVQFCDNTANLFHCFQLWYFNCQKDQYLQTLIKQLLIILKCFFFPSDFYLLTLKALMYFW